MVKRECGEDFDISIFNSSTPSTAQLRLAWKTIFHNLPSLLAKICTNENFSSDFSCARMRFKFALKFSIFD